jgi:MinD-like ATPase involved in chromosome partitioning or flagellar assembly
MSLPVLTAITGSWEAALVTGLERSAGDVRVVRRCVDLAELISAAAAGLGRAAVVSADLTRLDREAIAYLGQCGVAVVGVTDPGDDDARHRLRNLGVARVVAADRAGSEIALAVIDAVQELAPSGGGAGAGPADPDPAGGPWARPSAPSRRDVAMRSAADPADALAAVPSWAPDAGAGCSPGPAMGRVVAVWGPAGAPGRTTVAVSVAGELAQRGASTLLIDADTYGPSVAQTLGLLDESGGIAGAVRAANSGALDISRLARLAPCISPTLRVLTGLPQPSRWPELRPSALDGVWECSRELASWTVVDCGFCLEADEELSFDTAAPRRNGATLSALAAADTVLVVGSADPVGLQRLVRGLADLADLFGPGMLPRVVVTKVRASAVGSPPERRVTDALRRYAAVADAWLVPDDRAACDEAMLAGRMLVEIAPSSPARRALAELAAQLEERRLLDGLHDLDGAPGVHGPGDLARPRALGGR